MRYRGAVPELTRIVEATAKTDTPRVVALAALADIADPSSAPLFERLKADKYEPLRLYANEGIARTASADSKTAISAARLIEKSAWVRTAQAFALARIGELEYLDELVRALDRPLTRELAREYLLETPPANRQALFAPREISPERASRAGGDSRPHRRPGGAAAPAAALERHRRRRRSRRRARDATHHGDFEQQPVAVMTTVGAGLQTGPRRDFTTCSVRLQADPTPVRLKPDDYLGATP